MTFALRMEIEHLEEELDRVLTYSWDPSRDPEVKRLREEIAKLEAELKAAN